MRPRWSQRLADKLSLRGQLQNGLPAHHKKCTSPRGKNKDNSSSMPKVRNHKTVQEAKCGPPRAVMMLILAKIAVNAGQCGGQLWDDGIVHALHRACIAQLALLKFMQARFKHKAAASRPRTAMLMT